jgi:hypothetical protein
VTWAIGEKNYSQRRACRLVGLHPKTYRYASTRPDDGTLRSKLRELASQRRRFGYRRLGLLLARQGIKLNHKKLYRLYREERLPGALVPAHARLHGAAHSLHQYGAGRGDAGTGRAHHGAGLPHRARGRGQGRGGGGG